MINPERDDTTNTETAPRRHVLVEAYCAVNGQRHDDYGPALESFQRIADTRSGAVCDICINEQAAFTELVQLGQEIGDN